MDETQLLALVAHELRGPVHSLAVSSELLAAALESLDQQEIRAQVAGIHRRTLWLQGLLENLLCAALLQQGRFQIHRRPIDLAEAIEEVRPVVVPLLAEKDQPLLLRLGPIRRPVAADSRRIGQVLVNLILNASRFSPAGSPIAVALATRANYTRVSISDRGPGIPKGAGVELFAPFARWAAPAASAAPPPGQVGVGLGLAIVKSIVEAHGGRVGAETRPGGGARFWFELPADVAEARPQAC